MSTKDKDFILELVQSELETGEQLVESYDEFVELCMDEELEATKELYDFYLDLHKLGAQGFYEKYKGELDFDPFFVTMFEEDDIDESLLVEDNADDEEIAKEAVGVLYDMDSLVLSEEDNEYWLTYGIPDGEFDENSRELAEANYKDHIWLIEGEDNV